MEINFSEGDKYKEVVDYLTKTEQIVNTTIDIEELRELTKEAINKYILETLASKCLVTGIELNTDLKTQLNISVSADRCMYKTMEELGIKIHNDDNLPKHLWKDDDGKFVKYDPANELKQFCGDDND